MGKTYIWGEKMAVIKPKSEKRAQPLKPDTVEKMKLIIKSVAKGIPIKMACLAKGLHESHFYNFINQGIVDLKANEPTIHAKVVESFSSMQENFVNGCLEDIRNSDKGHRGAEWTLERSYWRYFSASVPTTELSAQLEELKKQIEEAKKDKLK